MISFNSIFILSLGLRLNLKSYMDLLLIWGPIYPQNIILPIFFCVKISCLSTLMFLVWRNFRVCFFACLILVCLKKTEKFGMFFCLFEREPLIGNLLF